MQSDAPNIDAYIAEAPEDRRENLTRLAAMCREILQGYEEGMYYRLPGFRKNGQLEVAFASQKNYISLYCLKESIMQSHAELLEGLSVGKGCIRYSKPSKMDFNVIRQLLIANVEAPDAPC